MDSKFRYGSTIRASLRTVSIHKYRNIPLDAGYQKLCAWVLGNSEFATNRSHKL